MPAFVPPASFDEYRLVRPLGSGAMGQVYLAHDTVLDRPVAVKLISAFAPDAQSRERFLVEARAIARLSHPNVVTIFTAGEVAGRPYLVSEYVRGQSLERLERPVPWARAREIALGLARGLAAAHGRGVLHRDIKPANVLLTAAGEVKLLDFGLAKLLPAGVEPMSSPGLPAVGGQWPGPGAAPAREIAPDPLPVDLSATDPALSVSLHDTPADAQRARSTGEADTRLTAPGSLLGTPRYMAPEAWRGEPATCRSDVYSLGAVIYELCSGRPPHPEGTLHALGRAAQEQDAPLLAALLPSIEPGPLAFAAVIDRCLHRDPDARYASGRELRQALEVLVQKPAAAAPAGNPYRGLRAFDAEHQALFFGRDLEIRALLDLLRAEPLVLVAGDSGVGKSSVCRAGVLPQVAAGALAEGRAWSALRLLPGRQPLLSLLEATAPFVDGGSAEELAAQLRIQPAALSRALRRRLGDRAGVVLFIDQMEELSTQAEPADAALFSEVLAQLCDRLPGVRVLATARGDFLTRLAALPALGPLLCRATYLLRPPSPEELREAITGPARMSGFRFESEAMIAALVEGSGAQGGLPLLQFALAELWQARDADRDLIPASALAAIGGVEGALARHADGVLARLLPEGRRAARRILVHLVTLEGTRARCPEAELIVEEATDRAALEALVRGRLLVAREGEGPPGEGAGDGAVYEVAHEALLRGWATLRGWLDADAGRRAVRARLELAAAEWQRLGRTGEGLWSGRQLREVEKAELPAAELPGRAAAFLLASRRSARRRLLLRLGVIVGAPLALVLAAAIPALRQRAAQERAIGAHRGAAVAALRRARAEDAAVAVLREEAFARFDRDDTEAAEAVWARALAGAARVRQGYGEATQGLEAALLLDGGRVAVRSELAGALYEQALLAERDGRKEQQEELLRRLATYDDGGALTRRWSAPAELHLRGRPSGAAFEVRRYETQEGRRVLGPVLRGGTMPARLQLPPGSYLVSLAAPGRVPVRYPVLLGRGERLDGAPALPAEGQVPAGFVPVVPGRFLYGSGHDEAFRRTFLNAQPLHRIETAGYLIARTEVTMGQWLDFLGALPPAERRRRRPHAGPQPAAIDVVEMANGAFSLRFQRGARSYAAGPGERLRYEGRRLRQSADWRRLPVLGVSLEDARAYVAWLDRSGKVRGARLCSEHEWERAARGADDRIYPHGDTLLPDDANFDETYGRNELAFGPDEVGAHPASDSPFGLADMAGNAWEWTSTEPTSGKIFYRGGGWYEGAIGTLLVNRWYGEATLRHPTIGLRVCADL